jgi:hypothetical protein
MNKFANPYLVRVECDERGMTEYWSNGLVVAASYDPPPNPNAGIQQAYPGGRW